ncbi:MAG: hypothetical protein HY868_08315 [Chloroflexi bacterium]|nr:hypothetical protein [Chloroflexota bacterium]
MAQAGTRTVPITQGKQVPSVCPYCAVGCGQIVTVSDEGKIIDILTRTPRRSSAMISQERKTSTAFSPA